MKLVIEHGLVKREIRGAYRICASSADLRHLREQIDCFLADESRAYGWVDVYERTATAPNTPPIAWGAEAAK